MNLLKKWKTLVKFIMHLQVCHQEFKNMGGITRHVLLHSDKEFFKCDACEKTFKNEPAGTQHKVVLIYPNRLVILHSQTKRFSF